MAKRKPLRCVHVIPDGSWGVKFCFAQYRSPSECEQTSYKIYEPSAPSILRVSRLLSRKVPLVSIDPTLGLSAFYRFPRRII